MNTSGPWFARRGLHGWGIDKSVSHGICTIHDNTDGSMREEQAANAHLIAAAPEMLESLKLCVEKLNDVWGECPATEAANAAIAKAIGGNSR